jgi:hypothetical protein
VRAALLESWPGLTHYFGIRPPDVGAYSVAELERYVDALREIDAEARRHAR